MNIKCPQIPHTDRIFISKPTYCMGLYSCKVVLAYLFGNVGVSAYIFT